MVEIAVLSIAPRRSDLPEEPGYRNAGVLRISDEGLQITTTWWNWRRHMAMPLGLMTTDLADVFSSPVRSEEVVLTMHRDKLESIRLRPHAEPLPQVQVVGIREEDGQRWLCSFSYRKEDAPLVERLESYIRPERVTIESGAPGQS